jgi:hypothetical protein
MTFGLPFIPAILQEAGTACNQEIQPARAANTGIETQIAI